MFISKKHIPRRTFLRGAGVTMALPLLDAMVPAATALAQTAATPKPRFFGGFVCHGGAPGYWANWKLKRRSRSRTRRIWRSKTSWSRKDWTCTAWIRNSR